MFEGAPESVRNLVTLAHMKRCSANVFAKETYEKTYEETYEETYEGTLTTRHLRRYTYECLKSLSRSSWCGAETKFVRFVVRHSVYAVAINAA